MLRIILLALVALTAVAQTRLDLRTQAKSVDFSGASSTKPARMGADLPTRCTIGELFFKTGASPGGSLYACTATDEWSVQGATLDVKSNGVAVGSRAAANFVAGPGLVSVISDTGQELELLWALDTALLQTKAGEQGGSALYCASDSSSASDYRCSLSPVAEEYVTGMALHWRPDVNGAGGATTLNVDTLGAKPVKLFDGAGDPTPADIVAGRIYDIRYDGAQFRLMPASARTMGALGDTGAPGIAYRAESGSAVPATADQMSGPFFCQDSGTAGAYACDLNPPITAYTAGTVYWFKAAAANSGATTINFNSLGPRTIRKASGQDLTANDIRAGQWVMLTYDGTDMQMLSQAAAGVGGNVTSVFGRTGAITAAEGDYTTAQVTESGNLYFTDERAKAAVNWGTLFGKPGTFPPSGHAATHRDGGSDEIATRMPSANGIPKAGADGRLDPGWLPASSGGSVATNYAVVFDGATTSLADGSTASWSCNGSDARHGGQCSTNWTVPAGVGWVRVQLWGGGGGGGGYYSPLLRSGVGGSGGGYIDTVCRVTPGTTVNVVVGMGGPGGTLVGGGEVDSTEGGTSSFGPCATVTGGRIGMYSSASGWGGMALNAPINGWQPTANGYSAGYCNSSSESAGANAGRMDQGGCGGPGRSAAGLGKSGGKGFGGGGGGGGAHTSDTVAPGGTGVFGGAGGAGGAWTAETGVTACQPGTVPGGGGGAAAGGATSSVYGCPGARGEVRVFYTN